MLFPTDSCVFVISNQYINNILFIVFQYAFRQLLRILAADCMDIVWILNCYGMDIMGIFMMCRRGSLADGAFTVGSDGIKLASSQ